MVEHERIIASLAPCLLYQAFAYRTDASCRLSAVSTFAVRSVSPSWWTTCLFRSSHSHLSSKANRSIGRLQIHSASHKDRTPKESIGTIHSFLGARRASLDLSFLGIFDRQKGQTTDWITRQATGRLKVLDLARKSLLLGRKLQSLL
jgi:hypothetical protein